MKKIIVTLSAAALCFAFAAFAAESVSGRVSLSPSLKGKVASTDTLYILARAAQGPRMPLAVFKTQVKDLPFVFVLDDSMAMNPAMRLSGADQVIVVARVSKSGDPMPHQDDLEGTSAPVKPGTTGINLVIDRIVR